MQCPTKLLKGSNVNTDYIIFSSSPVNIPSYSPQKYTFVFVQKKKISSDCKIIFTRDINGMKAFWKRDEGVKKSPMCAHYKYIAWFTSKIKTNWNTVYVAPFVLVWYDSQFNILSLEWLILFENLTISLVISPFHSLLPNF